MWCFRHSRGLPSAVILEFAENKVYSETMFDLLKIEMEILYCVTSMNAANGMNTKLQYMCVPVKTIVQYECVRKCQLK